MLDQVVRPVDLLALLAGGERIGKAAQMSRGLEDPLHPDGGSLDLRESLRDDKIPSPDVLNAPLHGRAQWAVIIKAGSSAVKLKGRPEEAPPPGKLINLLVLVHANPRYGFRARGVI